MEEEGDHVRDLMVVKRPGAGRVDRRFAAGPGAGISHGWPCTAIIGGLPGHYLISLGTIRSHKQPFFSPFREHDRLEREHRG